MFSMKSYIFQRQENGGSYSLQRVLRTGRNIKFFPDLHPTDGTSILENQTSSSEQNAQEGLLIS